MISKSFNSVARANNCEKKLLDVFRSLTKHLPFSHFCQLRRYYNRAVNSLYIVYPQKPSFLSKQYFNIFALSTKNSMFFKELWEKSDHCHSYFASENKLNAQQHYRCYRDQFFSLHSEEVCLTFKPRGLWYRMIRKKAEKWTSVSIF